MAKTTISDIARQAGVSKTAVSFAFNDPARLPDETVQRILKIADDLGYLPNPVARSLTSKRTGNIGVLFPQPLPDILANPYTTELLRGIGTACGRSGYNQLLVSPVLGNMRHAVSGAVVDGFLAIGLEHNKPTVELLDQRGVPYVMVDSESVPGIVSVNIDDAQGAYLAMRYALEQGHRRLAILGIKSGKHGRFHTYVGTLHQRISGYRAALNEFGLDIDGEQVRLIECACTYEGGQTGFAGCWTGNSPTAIITMADIIAIGALGAAHEAGVRVPQDVSIIGFDDLPITNLTDPALTTIHQPIAEKGEYAASQLLEILNGSASGAHRTFPTHLIERGSVARQTP
ncbi:MAG: LacI family DNA-binding transcriptional regulator [Anaerolineae bacterium]